MKQVGHAFLTVSLLPVETEEYLISLSRLRIDGLWYGSPYIELAETSYILKFYRLSIHGAYFPSLPLPPTSLNLTNQTDRIQRQRLLLRQITPSKQPSPLPHTSTPPYQGEWESRKLWYGVAKGIREGDFESAATFKGKIDSNEQRQRRRDESTGGTTWELKHFKHMEHNPVYEHLGKLFKANPPTEDGYVYLGNGPILSLRCLASTVVYL
ncbi:hypothetical protein EDB19DRAFT_1835431 [Suillus lakei]|nr:hypothetical protein EDB19DRAFT_1835431 [Suillus lakei]